MIRRFSSRAHSAYAKLRGPVRRGDIPKVFAALFLTVSACSTALADFSPRLVADISPGAAWSFPRGFVSHQGQVYFGATTDETSVSFWATDGTAEGTRLVCDSSVVRLQEELDHRHPLIVSDGRQMYFAGYDPQHGSEPWISDGTAAGTRMVQELYPGSQDPYAYVAPSRGGVVYAFLPELWRSDGSVAGTVLFSSPATGGPDQVSYPIQVDGRYWFAGSTTVSGLELWTSDGTAVGTHIAAELTPGPSGSLNSPLAGVGSSVLFRARPGNASVTENLYAMLADASSPTLLYQPPNVFEGRIQDDLVANNRFALFTVRPETFGENVLMVSDGTTAGTRKILAGDTSLAVSPYGAVIETDETYGYVGSSDGNLWRTDGTDAGTIPLTHFPPSEQRRVNRINPAGDFTFVGMATQLSSGDAIEELWLVNETQTRLLLSRVSPRTDLVEAFWYFESAYFGNQLYFTWPDETRGVELHVVTLPDPTGGLMVFGALMIRRRR